MMMSQQRNGEFLPPEYYWPDPFGRYMDDGVFHYPAKRIRPIIFTSWELIMNVMSSPLFSFLGKKISRGRHPLLRRHRAGESIIRENMRVCTGGTVGYDIFFPIATSCTNSTL
jgi:hypothetical protein